MDEHSSAFPSGSFFSGFQGLLLSGTSGGLNGSCYLSFPITRLMESRSLENREQHLMHDTRFCNEVRHVCCHSCREHSPCAQSGTEGSGKTGQKLSLIGAPTTFPDLNLVFSGEIRVGGFSAITRNQSQVLFNLLSAHVGSPFPVFDLGDKTLEKAEIPSQMFTPVHTEDPIPAGLFGFEALRLETRARAYSHVHANFIGGSHCVLSSQTKESHGLNKLWSRVIYSGVGLAPRSLQFQGIESNRNGGGTGSVSPTTSVPVQT